MKSIFVLFTNILLSIIVSGQNYQPTEEFLNTVHRHLRFLGNDIFEGRGTGQTGGDLSAKYLALEFNKLHLKPIGDNNTYYQYIPMHGSIPSNKSNLKIHSSEKTINLSLAEDYLLYSAGEHTLIPLPLEMVFVGFGIVAPEFDYNDYQDLDVEGKIVVMLEGEPYSNEESYFAGELPTVYSYHEAKQRIALSRGAGGSIIIPYTTGIDERWRDYQRMFAFEDISLSYSTSRNLSLLINPDKAHILFDGTKYNYNQITSLVEKNEMMSFELKTKLSFEGYYKQRDFLGANILGMIEGSDPKLKDSYIIISAHYDHLGIGPAVKGDSIYNGVFDNAAGVALMLEIAREINNQKNTPSRSIIFLAVTGEEKGLLGSTYYTNYPAVPLYKTVANINIDGVASFDNFKSIIGVGREFSTLSDYLNQTAAKFNLSVVDIPTEYFSSESFNRSDQHAFAEAGIPAIMILDGPDYVNLSREEGIELQQKYSREIYHTPFDDLSLPINYSAVFQHKEIIKDFILSIANSASTPEWLRGAPYSIARLRSIAEKR